MGEQKIVGSDDSILSGHRRTFSELVSLVMEKEKLFREFVIIRGSHLRYL